MTRKTILLISDTIIATTTGVGNVAYNIVKNLSHEYDFICIGQNSDKTNHGQIFDYSSHFGKDCKVLTLDCPYYGDTNTFSFLFSAYKIDAVLLTNDPHFHEQFFEFNHIVKQKCPIIWYNIWDNYPAPYFNLPKYDSCDTLLNISKLTQDVVLEVLGDKVENKIVEYVPHGVDLDVFYPVVKDSKEWFEMRKFKEKVLGNNPPKFMLFFNSKNISRKNIGTLLEAYKKCLDEGLDIGLFMHTAIKGEYDIEKYVETIFGKDFDWKNRLFLTNQEKFSTTELRWLYNICNVTILSSYNEGWGLSLTESLACNKPFIAPYIGGIIDQVEASEMYPILETFDVSTERVPLYKSYVSSNGLYWSISGHYFGEHFVTVDYRKVAEEYFDVKQMTSSISKYLKQTIDNFVPHKKYTLTKC